MARVLAIVGSPRKQGLSSALADSALSGAKEAGAEIEKIFLVDFEIEACRDCIELGCDERGQCNYPDDFADVSDRMDGADAGSARYRNMKEPPAT